MNDLSKLTIAREVKRATRAPFKRQRYVLLLVVAAIAAYAWYRSGGFARPPAVETASVSIAYPAQSLTLFNATGYVVPQTKADIASKATGRVAAIEVDEGSVVK